MKHICLSKEYLTEEYINKNRYLYDIAKEHNCSRTAIHYWCKKYGLHKKGRFDLTNRTFGKLTVIHRFSKDKFGHSRWIVKCDCGENRCVTSSALLNGNTTSCGCSRTTINNNHPSFRGYKEIGGKLWNGWKKAAKERGFSFDISIEYAYDLFIKQDRKCALTGLPLCFANAISKDVSRTASIDRIDSKQGYIIGNIQWVHKTINRIKWALDQSEFIHWCQLVTQHNYQQTENIVNI